MFEMFVVSSVDRLSMRRMPQRRRFERIAALQWREELRETDRRRALEAARDAREDGSSAESDE